MTEKIEVWCWDCKASVFGPMPEYKDLVQAFLDKHRGHKVEINELPPD